MATETVTQELLDKINAGIPAVKLTPAQAEVGEPYFDAEWERTSLAPLVRFPLNNIDVAYHGLSAVTHLLTVDASNRADVADNDNVTFSPLRDDTLEGLRMAQSVLLGRIGDCLESIKEGCKAER